MGRGDAWNPHLQGCRESHHKIQTAHCKLSDHQMLHLGQAYSLTWSFLVHWWFFWCFSIHCWHRKWVRLGPSLGMVYRLSTEGYSGQNRWCTDWEVKAYAAAERSETGSRTTYAALQVRVSEVLIVWKLRLKVQVEYWYRLYTAERLQASKVKRQRGHSPKPTVPPLCGLMYHTR